MNKRDPSPASLRLELPRLLFGSSALGNLYTELDESTKRSLVAGWIAAMPAPVCIDSAGKYGAGLALEEIGRALRALEVSRRDVVISNKLGWKRVPLVGSEPTFEPGVWKNLAFDARQAIGYDEILECWEQGNELLGDGYEADLLSVHDPDEYLASASSERERSERWRNIIDAYRALIDLKRDGKARAIGIGSKEWRVIRDVAAAVELDWVMFAGSLTIYTHPAELRAFVGDLARSGVFVINSAVFNAGFLVGGSYFDYRPVTRAERPELFTWRERFFGTCSRHGVVPADACVEFALASAGVSSVAMNTTRPERIADNVRSLESKAPDRFWDELRDRALIEATPAELA
jgi:D-threo-aldose 1-dehydrogenase